MKYRYVKPRREKHYVTFDQWTHKNLVEPGANYGEWTLTQELKSWLVKENIKVFVEYDSGDWGEGPPTVTVEFLNGADAKLFVETWDKNEKDNSSNS